MTTYTITITADDDSAASTRLRLETSGDQVILTDLHLHDGGGLSTGQLPAIDYGLLLRAIAATTPTPLSRPTAPTAPPAQTHDTTPAPTGPAAAAPARQRLRSAAPVPAPKTRGRVSASAPAAAAQPAAGGRSRTRRAGTGNKATSAVTKAVRAARKTTKATAAKASGRTTGGAALAQ